MSAAEKLGALDLEPFAFVENESGREAVAIDLDKWRILQAVLPQIVAVVEAAEGCFRIDQPSWNEVERRMAVALAALDEQLGDVT